MRFRKVTRTCERNPRKPMCARCRSFTNRCAVDPARFAAVRQPFSPRPALGAHTSAPREAWRASVPASSGPSVESGGEAEPKQDVAAPIRAVAAQMRHNATMQANLRRQTTVAVGLRLRDIGPLAGASPHFGHFASVPAHPAPASYPARMRCRTAFESELGRDLGAGVSDAERGCPRPLRCGGTCRRSARSRGPQSAAIGSRFQG